MTWKKFKWLAKYYAQYFPFTLNTLLYALVAYIGYKVLYHPASETAPEPFRPFILIMGKVIFWFILVLIAASVLSTIISWLYYLWLNRKKDNVLQLEFANTTKNGKKSKLYMNAMVPGAKRPFLGFIKGRLFYDDYHMTDKFSLLSNKRKDKSIWPYAISGKSRFRLPDIKEYSLKGGFLFFHDMLHLFSLAVPQPVKGTFHQPPLLRKEYENEVNPKKTETTDVRIEQQRRVDGELINYKDFEAGDDVRRIVWKIYAKNKELVVRIPERFQPYASHLYFYASFYADVNIQWLSENYLKEMLNYYKNYVWTVFDTLSGKGWDVRYIADQNINIAENLDDKERVSRTISGSSWHQDKGLLSYFDTKAGTVLCISSLTDINELKQILEQVNESTVIYYIKLSRTFRHLVAWNWFKRLIFLPPKDRLNKLRTRWTFSPMRFKIQKREKEIEATLKQHSATYSVL